MEIGVTREVPVALEVMNRAGRTTLDLGTLNLTGLRVRNGAGETRIDLAGYTGRGFDGEIRNGVGHLAIRVPKEYLAADTGPPRDRRHGRARPHCRRVTRT